MTQASSLPVFSLTAPRSLPGVGLSDHVNYWQVGYPAVMITDTAFYRNPHYHTRADTADTLDYRRMAQGVEGVLAAEAVGLQGGVVDDGGPAGHGRGGQSIA